tara:strand:+ start:47 stop:304 length:258 start_codon:yes stop_codon:yes gene_type:complete
METIVFLLGILSAYGFGFMSGIIFDRFKYNKSVQKDIELQQAEELSKTRKNKTVWPKKSKVVYDLHSQAPFGFGTWGKGNQNCAK